MEDLELLVVESLRRLESRLAAREVIGRLNALLTVADPSLVLPTPACALVEVIANGTWRPEAGTAFRTLQAHGPAAAESLFAPIIPDLEAHPWRVRDVEWLASPISPSWRRGLRLRLCREAGSRVSAGRLVLHAQGETVLAALPSARATIEGERVSWGRVGAPLAGRESGHPFSHALAHRVDALLTDLFAAGLPARVLARTEMDLEIAFEEPLVTGVTPTPPAFRANVLPAWNSIDVLSPSLPSVGQSVSEASGRYVHVLDARTLGRGWLPWCVDRAGAAGTMHPRLLPGSDGDGAEPRYHLAFLPAQPSMEKTDSGRALAVVLSREARRRLDEAGRALAVDFRATTGSAGNGVPEGEELQLIDLRGLPVPSRIVGLMVGSSWGGSDGLALEALSELPTDLPHALLVAPPRRTVADVQHVVRQVFGDRLELVEPRDLLRHGEASTISPLAIRVRFRRADLPHTERRQVLRACQSFLDDYVVGNSVGGIRLVDGGGSDDEHTI